MKDLLPRLDAFRTSHVWFVVADTLAILLAAVLPWSTSIFLILLIPFVAMVCGSVDVATFRRSFERAPSLVSIGFLILALLGLLWSEATWSECFHAVGQLVKFSALPLFLYYFERSARGTWVLGALFISCGLLMIYSWIITVEPTWALKTGRCCGEDYGVPVRNYIDQSQEFSLCLLALISASLYSIENGFWKRCIALALGTLLFATNLIFVVTSRTAIVCIPPLLLLIAWRHGRMSGVLAASIFGSLVLAAAWFASPHLRERIMSVQSQYTEYRQADVPSSVGKRIEFWRKSVRFFDEAPLFGHGTGSIHALFQSDAIGRSGTSAEVIANPHNQTLNVAVQWGIPGLIVLYVLWLVHLRMFLGVGLIAEIGFLVVAQNVVGSLFNSHLFDFLEGWLYVLGVGVTGGILAKHLDKRPHRASL
ncbi:O-antigen ligase family protein [Bradyrhizobium sp.]|uniref:O-antigen ligase family protein n=1 Tax=Bradyrhizobium sp. TaxID=376 RepID=UPI00260CE965|nr:O-antigen ligase family protein [Bradyrhizobium sp.]